MDQAGALVVPYGTMSAVELSLTDIMAKIGGGRLGQVQVRAVRIAARACRAGKLSEATLHAEIGEIVAGRK
jgi:ornithine cyclodeaminase